MAEEVRAGLDDGHRGAEAPVRLGELAADVAAPDHDQVLRQLAELHHPPVVEPGDLGEAGDGRLDGPRADVQDHGRGPVALSSDLHGPLAHEPRLAADQAEIRGCSRDPPGDALLPAPHDAVLPRDDRREVHLDRLGPDAQPPRRARNVRGAGARDQGLGGGAAGVDAGAAQLGPLHQQDLLPAGGQPAGQGGAGLAGADDDDVLGHGDHLRGRRRAEGSGAAARATCRGPSPPAPGRTPCSWSPPRPRGSPAPPR